MCVSANRECGSRCSCKVCKNRALGENASKKTYIGRSTVEGFGLFAAEDIKRDDFVLEYTGEVITNAEAERRGHFYEKKQVSYLFDVSSRDGDVHHTVDAMAMGNNSRFANHSSQPNIKAKILNVNGVQRVGFYALRDINKHCEMFFDYQYKEEHKSKYNIRE